MPHNIDKESAQRVATLYMIAGLTPVDQAVLFIVSDGAHHWDEIVGTLSRPTGNWATRLRDVLGEGSFPSRMVTNAVYHLLQKGLLYTDDGETYYVTPRASRHIIKLGSQQVKTAGEVRFIKDRGGDHQEWAWNPPGSSQREIDPDYKFEARNLKPLAASLRSMYMALGHAQSAFTSFSKIKSQRISPDGNLGGKGYVMPIKDMRKQLANCVEALSACSDTVYDELQAVHWHPQVDDSGGDPRERREVKEIMDDVEEIREDPEEWAEGEEEEMDNEDGRSKRASHTQRLAALYLAKRKAR